MDIFAKLIHKSYMTYLPTNLPVQFYGLPDGKVYLIYARFYEIGYEKSDLEFVFAEHEEFLYDYENEKLKLRGESKPGRPVYDEMVDKPDPKIKILNVYRNINSFAEAFIQINKKAENLFLNESEEVHVVSELSTKSRRSIA